MTLWDRAFRDSSGGGRDDDDDDEQGQQHNNNKNNKSGAKKIRRDMKCKEARDVLAKFGLALKKAFVVVGVSTTTSTTNSAKLPTTTAEQKNNNNNITNNDDETDSFEGQQQQQCHHHLEAPNGHFPPLWGVVTQALHISARDSVYVFLLNHAKSLVSAAVRASLIGPYQAQGLLGSGWLRKELERLVDRVGVREEEEEEKEGDEEEEEEEEEEKEEEEEEEGGADGDEWRRKVEEAGQGVPAMDIWLGRHELLYSRIFNS